MRETEKRAAKIRSGEEPPPAPDAPSGRKDPVYQEMQLALENELARKVTVKVDRKGGGIVEIAFYSKEDLGSLAMQIAGEAE